MPDTDHIITTHPDTGDPIRQSDLDAWCNCFNFPHEKCDECKVIFYEHDKKKDEDIRTC